MLRWTIVLFLALSATSSFADQGYVVKRFGGCDYFIADGEKGLYVLEWYGGHDPSEGDTIVGDIGSYGFKDVVYNSRNSGRVYVEDFLESASAAMDEIEDHCNFTRAPANQSFESRSSNGRAPPGTPEICNCRGYDGPGGPCYSGPGGPAYDGPGGPAYDGPGGPCYDGPGGPMYGGPGGPAYDGPGGPAYNGPGGPAYDGPGGPCYDGPGGPAYDGPGGPCYDGPGGTGENCPAICR